MGLLADTRPLGYAPFRRLWVANIVTVIGAQMTVVAIPAQIFHITGSSGYVGLAGAFGLVPLIVFGLWGGSLADVFDRRKLLVISTVGLIITSTILALLAVLSVDNVWLLLSVFSMQQAFFGLNQPAKGALIPSIVPLKLLPAANSLNMTVMTLGAVIGPVLGGAMIPLFGYQMLYVINRYRVLSQTPEEAAALLQEIEAASRLKATALVNNSHLGVETCLDTLLVGLDFARKTAQLTGQAGPPGPAGRHAPALSPRGGKP